MQHLVVDGGGNLRFAPYLAGLLFLCYPFHNEAIIWIVGRGTSMATLAALLTLWVLTSDIPQLLKQSLSTLCVFVGALAYESALLIPILALPILVFRGTRRKYLVGYAISWGIAVALHLLMRRRFCGGPLNAYGRGIFRHAWTNYAGNLPKVLGRLFLPPDANSRLQVLVFVLLIISLTIVAIRLWRSVRGHRSLRQTVLALGWMLLISLFVAEVAGVSTRTSESDRFLYMPSAFLCALAAVAVLRLPCGKARGVVIVLLMALSLLELWLNDRHWVAASQIMRATVREIPEAPVGHRLFITGLPSDVCGAFIFRNGSYEALLLAGRDTARMVVADRVLPGTTACYLSIGGDTVSAVRGDREYVWKRNTGS
jgi:hypothetical protein